MKYLTYLINLDSSTTRLMQADAELKKHNIEYERIAAVDGRKLDVPNYANYDSQKAWQAMGRDLAGGEIGCYLSHVKCVEAFLASDADYAIVLEDDLEIISDLNQIVEQTLMWLEQQNITWYLINIGNNKRKICRKLTQFEQHDLLKAYYFPVLTLGLIWSRQGATEFLNRHNQISMPIDVTLQVWLSQNGLGLSFSPALIQPNGADSDIDAVVGKNHNPQRARIGKRLPRQKRMWSNKWLAFKNMILDR